jgi:hypothetical protein
MNLSERLCEGSWFISLNWGGGQTRKGTKLERFIGNVSILESISEKRFLARKTRKRQQEQVHEAEEVLQESSRRNAHAFRGW